ncbi:MAG: ABC transporter ATP-binding protein [Thermoproteota archaeon]|jgi:energy-coupling factor transporter ATP-binding protein EcfA2|nr:ABC transporter ATP-binding protein [Thermoproteota archaeon]
MKEVIVIKDLSFRYQGTNFFSLKNINLKIYEGDFVLLAGPSGCGKTTLIRLLNGLIPHFYKGDYIGEVSVYGLIVKDRKTYEMAKHVGMVFQDPEDQLLSMTVEKEIAFGLENLGYKREEMFKIVNEIIKLLNIEHIRFKSPYLLSGGEQQKVAIGSVLAIKPRILALDEPFSNLDLKSSYMIADLLNYLNKNFKYTIIIAEHRLEILVNLINRIIVMNEGRIIFDGTKKEVLSKDLESIGIMEPKISKISKILSKKYNFELCLTLEEFINNFKKIYEINRN